MPITNVKKIKESTILDLSFHGKCVHFPVLGIKPSEAYKILESNRFSKDKLHFIVTEQPNNSILVLKYNDKSTIKITEFVNNLIQYYRNVPSLQKEIPQVVVEGNDTYSLIKNIPDLKVIQIIKKDIMKLLGNIPEK
jgi:predicted ester cyclase